MSASGFLLENVSRSIGTHFEHCQALCSRFRQTKPPASTFLPILGNFEHLLQFSCFFYPRTHLVTPRKWFTTAQDLPLAFWTASLKFSSCICLFRHIPSFWQSPLHTHTPYRTSGGGSSPCRRAVGNHTRRVKPLFSTATARGGANPYPFSYQRQSHKEGQHLPFRRRRHEGGQLASSLPFDTRTRTATHKEGQPPPPLFLLYVIN